MPQYGEYCLLKLKTGAYTAGGRQMEQVAEHGRGLLYLLVGAGEPQLGQGMGMDAAQL